MSTVKQQGSLEVICGSMFSGKTEELIRRLRRAEFAKQKIQVFKPVVDNRYDSNAVVSHGNFRIEGVALDRPRHVLYLINDDTQVIGIDEVQFFSDELIDVIAELTGQGKRVICAGLDQDFRGQPFGCVPQLLAMAEEVTKVRAICMQCGDLASKSQRLSSEASQVQVGATDCYEPRCRACHTVDKGKENQ